MAIEIQCDQCQQSYKVGDNLGGRRVKCRNCGAPILVPQKKTDGVEEEGGAMPLPGRRSTAAENCPNCSAAVAPDARICLACGFDLATGRPNRTQLEGESAIGGIGDAPDQTILKKRKAWTRSQGNSSLEQLDEILKIAIAALLLAGIVVGAIHLSNSPGGLTGPAIVPMLIMIGLLAVLVAPLATYGVNTLLRQLKILPRDDTYTRLAVTVVFPFAFSLILGWPGGPAVAFVPLGWIAAGVLLIYLFRGNAIEWTASVFMGAAVIAICTLAIGLLAGPINSLTGPMDPSFLPGSPWNILATGTSAPPANDTGPVAITKPHPPTPAQTLAALEPLPDTIPTVTPIPGGGHMTPPSATNTQITIATTTPPVDTRPTPPTTITAATQRRVTVANRQISSPYFANIVTDEPGLRGVNEFIVAAPPMPPATASPYFLAIKNSDTSATVDRWSVSPVEKKGSVTFPLLPAMPNTYVLSAKGDLLATLVVFPQMKIEITNFETGAAPKIITLIPPVPTAVATLVGFMDPTRLCIRWDADGNTALQIWNVQSGLPFRNIDCTPVDPDPAHMALSPNGRTLAILTARSKDPSAKQPGIQLLNLDAANLATFKLRTIDPTPLAYKPVCMAFSPDGTGLALYAVVADIPVVMSFRVATGEAASNSEPLSSPPVGSVNHALQWLGPKTWLINGNELVDAATGRKLGQLNILEETGLVDQSLAGPASMIFLVQSSPTEKSIAIARIDDAKIAPK